MDMLAYRLEYVRDMRTFEEELMGLEVWRVSRQRVDASGKLVAEVIDHKSIPVRDDVYEGPAKRQSYEGYETALPAGSSTVTLMRTALHFPIGAFAARDGDLCVCVSSQVDPHMVGRVLVIKQDVPFKTLATAYRCFTDELLEKGRP